MREWIGATLASAARVSNTKEYSGTGTSSSGFSPAFGRLAKWGEDPMESVATPCHPGGMRTWLSLLMLPFFFAGSGFWLAGLIGGVIGLILLICLFLHFTGGFHPRSK